MSITTSVSPLRTIRRAVDGPYLRNVSAATLMAWVKATSFGAANAAIIHISTGTNNANPRAELTRAGVNLRLRARALDADTTSVLTTTGVFDGSWIHAAVTIDYTNARGAVYMDGSTMGGALTSMTPGNTSDTDSLTIAVGAVGSGGVAFDGDIEDAIVWSRILSPAEIQSIAAKRAPLSGSYIDPSLLFHWPLREGAPGQALATAVDIGPRGLSSDTFNGPPLYSDSFIKKRKRLVHVSGPSA